ncbi:MAG TPA: hypothetical protein VGP07_15805 [Polyangia bacterium]
MTRVLKLATIAAFLGGLACGDRGASNTNGQPDSKGCCAPDPMVNGCMNLGGYNPLGCLVTCDFYCSTNWRLEDDDHGCPVWRYDTRAPLPGESLSCFPALDAGSDG